MRILSLIFLLSLLPTDAFAGAWPRAEGSTFLSFGTTVTTPTDALGTDINTAFSLYLERGMKRQRTFGFDLHAESTDKYTAIAFLRVPVLRRSETHKFALQFGAGSKTNGATNEWLLHSGVSWGRGFETKLGHGWAAVDAQMHYFVASGEMATKVDVTFGVKPKDRWKIMMQLQAGDYPSSDPYLRLAPSITWEMRPGRHLEVGAQIGVHNDDRLGLKIGTWIEF